MSSPIARVRKAINHAFDRANIRSNCLMNKVKNPTVILGGGFAGLFTAIHLSRHNYPKPIVLIDRDSRFTFQPLLYEFLSEEMESDRVCPLFAKLLAGKPIKFIRDAAEGIDLENKTVRLASGFDYSYEHLVLALGSVANYFGVEGVEENALTFRNREDAIALREHLRDCLQKASLIEDSRERHRLLTVALVGGGPAGVELAGTLADLLPKWYDNFGGDPREIHVLLLDRGSEILCDDINGSMGDLVLESFQKRQVSVDLRFNSTVTQVEPDRIRYKHNGEELTLETSTLLWTAGVQTHPLMDGLSVGGENRDRKGRVKVTRTLQLPDFPEVFAGGDCVVKEQNLPPLAEVAYQEGAAIARNLKAIADGKEPLPSEVNLRGSLLKLGLNDSAAHLFKKLKISGKPGHLIRQGVYLELLPTPARNLKETTEWLMEEIFRRHSTPLAVNENAAPR